MLRKAKTMGNANKPLHGPLALRAMAGRARAGFTLMEIVVAVGAVALVAVGLASIFDTVGKTVTGGKRVSVLNTYAGLLERQMRDDFEHMSRDGFLVIRQQWVDGADGAPDGKFDPTSASDRVPVSSEDLAPQARRIDEILFFVNGRFESGRPPMWPGVQAKSNVAEVYYGHGQTSVPIPDIGHPAYRKPFPFVRDRNQNMNARLGIAPTTGTADSNPNYYAGNWTLLRRVTLLSKAGTADSPATNDTLYGMNSSRARDHAVLKDQATQIALQPASSSIFRSIASVYPADAQTLRRRGDNDTFFGPFLASGIVDIASTDLAEVRTTVTSGGVFGSPNPIRPDEVGTTTPFPMLSIRSYTPFSVTTNDLYRNARPAAYNDLDRMQAWMSDAFPTDSRNLMAAAAAADFVADVDDGGAARTFLGTRMRYEPDSTDLMAAMSFLPDGNPIAAAPNQTDRIKIAEARGDQRLLGSGNLVPHCSGFIVEWSFGNLDRSGEVVWHGPSRQAGATVVRPYPWDTDDTNPPPMKAVPVGQYDNAAGQVKPAFHNATDRLIYGFSPIHDATIPGEACLTSYFGWTDPTYVRSTAPPPPGYVNNTTDTAAWPWPRMIRVTITLSDPLEPTIESTFQYVFTTPADPK